MFEEFIRHARAVWPFEACGLVVAQQDAPAKVEIVDNTSPDPARSFRVSAASMVRRDVVALVHSHPLGGVYPSVHDLAAHSVAMLDGFIVGMTGPGSDVELARPIVQSRMEYIGRLYQPGAVHCYSLIRDWLAVERAVYLPPFFHYQGWESAGINWFEDTAPVLGFRRVVNPEPGDVVLMRIGNPFPNHCGILLEDGVLHHLADRHSGVEPYDEKYRKRTTSIWRPPVGALAWRARQSIW